MIHFGLLYRLDISTFHFYEPSLFQIFFPLELCKHLVLPLYSIIFRANSQADNHFYEYIYLFQTLYNIESVFLLKFTLRFFVFKFDLNVKYCRYFF